MAAIFISFSLSLLFFIFQMAELECKMRQRGDCPFSTHKALDLHEKRIPPPYWALIRLCSIPWCHFNFFFLCTSIVQMSTGGIVAKIQHFGRNRLPTLYETCKKNLARTFLDMFLPCVYLWSFLFFFFVNVGFILNALSL